MQLLSLFYRYSLSQSLLLFSFILSSSSFPSPFFLSFYLSFPCSLFVEETGLFVIKFPRTMLSPSSYIVWHTLFIALYLPCKLVDIGLIRFIVEFLKRQKSFICNIVDFFQGTAMFGSSHLGMLAAWESLNASSLSFFINSCKMEIF